MIELIVIIVLSVLLLVSAGLLFMQNRRIKPLQQRLEEAQLGIEGANNRVEQAQAQVTLLQSTDAVTGLLNRQVVIERFQLARALARRLNMTAGVVLIQLPNFDDLVAKHGAEGANRLLVAFGNRLMSVTREMDTVGRVRDYEFAVLLPLVPEARDVETVLGKLRTALEPPFTLVGSKQEVRAGAFLGFASYPKDGDDWGTVLKAADESLARNRIQV